MQKDNFFIARKMLHILEGSMPDLLSTFIRCKSVDQSISFIFINIKKNTNHVGMSAVYVISIDVLKHQIPGDASFRCRKL